MFSLHKSVVVGRPLELWSATELLQRMTNLLVTKPVAGRKVVGGIGAVSDAVLFLVPPALRWLIGIHICVQCHVRRSLGAGNILAYLCVTVVIVLPARRQSLPTWHVLAVELLFLLHYHVVHLRPRASTLAQSHSLVVIHRHTAAILGIAHRARFLS